jgi:hypothetical protein
MVNLTFMEIIHLSYKEFLLEELIDEADEDDFDEDELAKQLDKIDFDKRFFGWLKENKEEVINQYLAQELSEDKGEISIEVEDDIDDPDRINIEIIRVEILGDTDYIYTSFHQSLSSIDLARLQSALINDDTSLLEKHLDDLVKREGNLLEVEEETVIYKYHISFDLENKIEHIDNIQKSLDKCIVVFYEALEDEDGFLEF